MTNVRNPQKTKRGWIIEIDDDFAAELGVAKGSITIRQAATLYFGLIKNHTWLGGNKRTATVLVDEFLYFNQFEVKATVGETIKLVLAIESDEFGVDEIENWLREKTFSLK